ncbi:putative baseplate assembly protein [Actinokineospora sp. NBRC 105648]|uniref:putative baseplate assembly protein n=1 Tax=Actinokineospora sp. NBRC 105648 TaxID=3032206 RepID=UPI0024A36BAD|nr:putative baseplate assembly protein [Actinokineospora sp. NBRC 105648]GLZ42713.1 putative baseplate assembly protein [Actinokineospora sp. NBRC 105648]
MALPAPNLDDRRFQQLVDEAKRYVQQRTPEWTDHNVSDPGVTLIETFAHMVDQLVYRLNRVPERHYLAFLDLLGIRLFPPSAARADVVFWLSAARAETVLLGAGTEVATQQSESGEAVVFATVAELPIVPCALDRLVTATAAGEYTDRTNDLNAGKDVRCFQAKPVPGDVALFGLSAAVPRCVVAVRLDSRVEGIGVDPRQPPLVWEAWTGDGWRECEAFEDTTGGLNRPGEVVLLVPAGHVESVSAGVRAGWLRCRAVAPVDDQPFYSESPTVRVAEVDTIGGVTAVEHAETVLDADLGTSEGVAGQRFRLDRAPVLPGSPPLVVQVSSAEGWQDWAVVEHFGRSEPGDRHVTLDSTTGEVEFPPAVREADGGMRTYGAVPTKGAHVRVPRYRTGGGRTGNVARGTISVLRSSVPYVSSVENREGAQGGVDGETVAEARIRAPRQLRVQERAVTADDYEHLTRLAAPTVARVRCLPAGPGAARVLVVPDVVPDLGGRLRFEQLIPTDEMLAAIASSLDERRLIGTTVAVEPPFYQGITVVARLRSTDRDVADAALAALYDYLDPIRGGEDGTGWPFGRPVQFGAVFAVLQRVAGVDLVEEVRLFPADPITGRRGSATERVELAGHALVFSHQHQVLVGEP